MSTGEFYCILDEGSIARSPGMNLALEEALLEAVAREDLPSPLLRLWVNPTSIVLGRFSSPSKDVNLGEAGRLGVPIVRRISGGGTVFHDPGNLNISLFHKSSGFIGVREVMGKGLSLITSILVDLGFTPEVRNGNDIVVGGYKVSGTASYASRRSWLFHGTLLVNSNLALMRRLLVFPDDPTLGGRVDPVKYNPGNLSNLNPTTNLEKILATVMDRCSTVTRHVSSSVKHIAFRLFECKYSAPGWTIKGILPRC
ncbi:MAG: lipoate--protein ligase family protein [Desulfurococcales archaeon]|nr:lipoate--protein ligase family protein [Desulfurococcales archaeon]